MTRVLHHGRRGHLSRIGKFYESEVFYQDQDQFYYDLDSLILLLLEKNDLR